VKSGTAGRARADQVIQAQTLPHLDQSLARSATVGHGRMACSPENWSSLKQALPFGHNFDMDE